MNGSQEAYDACKRMFHRERRLTRLEGMVPRPSSIIIKQAADLYDQSKRELEDLGVNQDFYWSFKMSYEQEFTRQRDADEASRTCSNWIRHVQAFVKDPENTMPLPACCLSNNGCSMNCPMREEADDEDIQRFQNGIDLDTGEVIKMTREAKDSLKSAKIEPPIGI